MSWTNIVVEGFCFGDVDKNGSYPCGQNCPSPFCLGGDEKCPHFACSNSDEREAAYYVPLHLIFWDRIKIFITETAYWEIRWWLWDHWGFNRRKMDEFFKSIPTVTARDCPSLGQWELGRAKANRKFKSWLRKATKKGEELNG